MTKQMTGLMVAVVLIVVAGVTAAAEFGTREQAKAMLDRAISVLKADKDRALDLFTSGNGGFIDSDYFSQNVQKSFYKDN